jgi:hypothetical protein
MYHYLAFIASELIIRLGNQTTLREYAALQDPLPDKTLCDNWVQAHIAAVGAALPAYPGVGEIIKLFLYVLWERSWLAYGRLFDYLLLRIHGQRLEV